MFRQRNRIDESEEEIGSDYKRMVYDVPTCTSPLPTPWGGGEVHVGTVYEITQFEGNNCKEEQEQSQGNYRNTLCHIPPKKRTF